MAGGKFIRSKKDILPKADWFYAITDLKLRSLLIDFSEQFNEEKRQNIINTYNNPKLASAYAAWRNFNDLNDRGFTKRKTMREIVRVPAGDVYEFLRAYFEPVYGENWMQNRKALRHELIRPWWVVSKI